MESGHRDDRVCLRRVGRIISPQLPSPIAAPRFAEAARDTIGFVWHCGTSRVGFVWGLAEAPAGSVRGMPSIRCPPMTYIPSKGPSAGEFYHLWRMAAGLVGIRPTRQVGLPLPTQQATATHTLSRRISDPITQNSRSRA